MQVNLLVLFSFCPLLLSKSLKDAPRLTLGELVGKGTTEPPVTSFEIPPNPLADIPGIKKVEPIPLPVFDPSIKFEYPPEPNRAKWIDMPNAVNVTFDDKHLPLHYDLTKPIHIDIGKYTNHTYLCGFCLELVTNLKKEIDTKGINNFTERIIKECQAQKDIGQGTLDCEHLPKDKMQRIKDNTINEWCINEKMCTDDAEITLAQQVFKTEAILSKEQEKLQEKLKVELEQGRKIVEAQEDLWRREFKRTHNDSVLYPPIRINMPEGEEEGSGIDNWKPTFGEEEEKNETITGMEKKEGEVLESQTRNATLSEDQIEEQTDFGVEEEIATKEHLKGQLESAKKAEEEEVGFISKPVEGPSRDTSWKSGPKVELIGEGLAGGKGEKKEEEVSEEKEYDEEAQLEKKKGMTTEGQKGQVEENEEEERFPAPKKAPIQCNKPTTELSSDQEEEEKMKEVKGLHSTNVSNETLSTVSPQEEGPANLVIKTSNETKQFRHPFEPKNRIVRTEMYVDDIAQ